MTAIVIEENTIDHCQQITPARLHLYYDAEQSSFEEVAGTCPNKDDQEMRCLTVRSILIGLICVIGMSFLHIWIWVNGLDVLVPPMLVILVAHVISKVWTSIPWPKVCGEQWTIKEHTLVLIMSNIAWTFYTVYNFATMNFVEWQEEQPSFKFVYMFFLVIAIQYLGFGLAGILRRFLVWPSGQVWPGNLPSIALLRTLHENQADVKKKIYGANNKKTIWERFIGNRLVFFLIIMVVQFVYCWFPQYIMPVLGFFSWMCMIKPSNYPLAQITGSFGLGIGSLTFDWYKVTFFLGSPLVVPRWAVLNLAVGFVLIIWTITPIIYFEDVWGTRSKAIGQLTKSTNEWSAISLITTATAFASLSAVLVHMLLHHAKELWIQLRSRSLGDKGNDVHCRLIALYPDVPDWWFAIVSLLALIVIVVVAHVSNMLDWYNVLFALTLPILFVLPFGMIASITGQTIHNSSIYYLGVVIASSLWADDRLKMLTFVAIGYTTYCQTLQLVSDMKLGHYMKIPPRILFSAQAVTVLVCSSFSIGIQYYYYTVQYDQTGNITLFSLYDLTNVGNTINLEMKFFDSSTSRNRDLLWSLLIGAVLPVLFWLTSRRWKWCRHVHIPLILTFVSWAQLARTGIILTWLLIALLTTSLVKKVCWQRHIYLTSSALDVGFYLALLVVGGPLTYYNINFPSWWGTGGVNQDGCPLALQDGNGTLYDMFGNIIKI